MALLRLPEPYDFELSTARYRSYGVDLANVWHEGGLHRVVDGREVRITAARGGVEISPLDAKIRRAVEVLLGVHFDLDSFYEFAQGDPVLAGLVQRLPGLRPALTPDPLEALVSAISAQQVSLHAAFAVRSRLVERFGVRAVRAYAFPAREALAAAAPSELTALGFSFRKAEYVIGVAASDLDFAELALLSDGEVKERLTALKGLGEWTADWFLARHLGRPEAWPAGDLGLRKAASRFYGDGRSLTTEEVRALAPRFAPFQTLTAHYLLAGLTLP